MKPTSEPSITELLQAWHAGSEDARNRVFELTYGELRKVAAGYLQRERGRSIQVTALVHEAFLRLIGTRAPWMDRRHFYGVAAQAMRRILLDHARRRAAVKRQTGAVRVGLDAAEDVEDRDGWSVLQLDAALTDLERLDARQARVVELRCFGGLTVQQVAELIDVSPATVKREWSTARAWLARRMLGPA